MPHRWLIALGKIALVLFLFWHMGVALVSAVPEQTPIPWLKNLRGELIQITEGYAYRSGQWQGWSMFSQGSVQTIFSYSFDVWSPEENDWVTVQDLSFEALPLLEKSTTTGLLRALAKEDNWLSRERYLQLKCLELGRPPREWVRLGQWYFNQPLDDEKPFSLETWEQWERVWHEWHDSHWTRCPDPNTPMSEWPIPQDGSAWTTPAA